MSLEDVLGKLNKKTRDRVRLAESISLDRMPLPSRTLTSALGGGLGYGRQSLLWGTKSAGKSSLALQAIGMAQKEGKVCAWIDAEQSYDKDWASRLGVDSSNLIISPIKSIPDLAEVGVDLMNAGVDIIVVDSISALLPSSYFEDPKKGKSAEELKSFDKTGQIGSESKDLGKTIKMLNYSNDHTALILISQVRNKIGSWGASQSFTGGFATSFFSSTIIKVMSTAKESEQYKQTIDVRGMPVEKPVGREVSWSVEFNKIGPPSQLGKYDFYYDGEFVGVDFVGELVDNAVAQEIIVKGGSGWFTLGDVKIQGRENLIKHVRSDESVMESLVSSVKF